MISIIIVNYNVEEHLQECLDSLYKFNDSNKFEVIVLDNSQNSKINSIINGKNNIRLYSFENNVGFSKAVNYGLKVSRGSKILLLNPDTIIISDFIDKMSSYLDGNKNVGIVGAKVLFPNGKYQISSKRSFPHIYMAFIKFFYLDKLFYKNKYFGKYNYSFIDENIVMEVDSVSGSCMMFNKDLNSIVGDFDERFFLYFEDTDFCYRVKNKNYKVIYNPEIEIIHKKRQSFHNSKYSANYEFFKSLYAFYIKYYDEYENSRLLKKFVKESLRFLIFILGMFNFNIKKIK